MGALDCLNSTYIFTVKLVPALSCSPTSGRMLSERFHFFSKGTKERYILSSSLELIIRRLDARIPPACFRKMYI